ncbi:MAG TPA: CIA30 family protein [Kofleriaceae bacterium]|nr:CIA30 family protein [Kofleriaceae bacterium]
MRLAFIAISFALWTFVAPAHADPPSLRVDDFEDLDLEAATGLSWTAVGDWLMGGESSGAVAVARPSPGNASRGALRIDGHLRGVYSFAGAWVALRADGTPADLTGYAALRFRVRGTPGNYEAGVRRTEGRESVNFMAPFTVAAAWGAVELPFGDLKATMGSSMAFATTGIGWLGITSSAGAPRDFAIEIDDVELVPAQAARAGGVHKVKLGDPRTLDRLAFSTIARDDRGDGTSPRLPDARELQLAVDPADDRVWFRFVLQSPPPTDAFGLNIALDIDGDPDNGGAWWGQNTAFHFDRLVTAYLSRGAGYWQGFVGVADPAQAAAFAMDGCSSDVRVVIDPARRTLAAGVPRAALGLPAGGHVRLIGTVGSSFTFSDDVPAEGALEVDVPEPAGGHSVSH